jgi:hypothetical protein
MSLHRNEEFGDPVVVPGPNLRGRFTGTETVAEGSELVDPSGAGRCPTCGRVLAAATLVCPDDGTAVLALPADA